jgi:formylglycine-generating enzyme required for sulfatase activity
MAVLPVLLMMVTDIPSQSMRDCTEACPSIALVHPTSTSIKPFYMTIYEITWAEYLPAVREAGCAVPVNDSKHTSIDISRGDFADNFPVTGVSPTDFRCFISWLNKTSGRRYRLPTSREWLEAARNAPAKPMARAKSHDSQLWDHRYAVRSLRVFPVGGGDPTDDGIYDLEGNAAEFTSDRRVTSNPDRCHEAGFANCYLAGVIGLYGLRLTAAGSVPGDYKKLQWSLEESPNLKFGFRLVRDQ